MIVVPAARERRGRSRAAAASRARSSAAVGSSITISCASRESARRISTFCCSARAQPSGRHRRPAGRSRPSAASARVARVAARRRRMNAAADAARRRGRRSRATVSCGTTNGSCAIAATPCSSASRGERNATALAVERASGRRRRQWRRRRSCPSVDLPAPFSPTSACTEPPSTASVTPASAWTPPKCLATSRSSRYGAFSPRAGVASRATPP